MRSLIKNITFTLLLLPALINTAFAANNNSNIKVSAQITPGCNFSANNFDLGVRKTSEFDAATFSSDITIQCSKNTPIILNMSDTLRSKYFGSNFKTGLNFSWIGQAGDIYESDKDYKYIWFRMDVGAADSSSISIVKAYSGTNGLGNTPEYQATLTPKVGTPIVIPMLLKTTLQLNKYGMKDLIPGNYFETIKYTLTY